MNGEQGGFVPPDGGQWPNEGSPAGRGTPYGQEPSGAPGAYGRQPYGQDGPYRDPYGAGTSSYGLGGEPPKKSRAGLIVGVAVVAVIAVIGAVAAVLGASSGDDKAADAPPPSASPSAVDADVPHSIRVPRTFGGYRRLTGSTADRLAQSMRKAINEGDSGKYADLYAKAKVAIYAKNSDPTQTLFFIGLSSSDNPAVARELESTSPSQEVDSAFIGIGIGDTKDFPSGPLGGVLRCGAGSMEGTSVATCAWADSSTVGMVIAPDSRNATALGGSTLKLRNAAEH